MCVGEWPDQVNTLLNLESDLSANKTIDGFEFMFFVFHD